VAKGFAGCRQCESAKKSAEEKLEWLMTKINLGGSK
jgi:hypothetical protein